MRLVLVLCLSVAGPSFSCSCARWSSLIGLLCRFPNLYNKHVPRVFKSLNVLGFQAYMWRCLEKSPKYLATLTVLKHQPHGRTAYAVLLRSNTFPRWKNSVLPEFSVAETCRELKQNSGKVSIISYIEFPENIWLPKGCPSQQLYVEGQVPLRFTLSPFHTWQHKYVS